MSWCQCHRHAVTVTYTDKGESETIQPHHLLPWTMTTEVLVHMSPEDISSGSPHMCGIA